MLEIFCSLILKTQNEWFPIVVKEVKTNKNEWFNTTLNSLIKFKNKQYKIWKKYGNTNPNLKNNYLESKYKCTKEIRKAKNEFILNKISNIGKDTKSKWKFLNSILKKGSNDSLFIPEISYNNILISDNKDIANLFNKEFSYGIREKLQEKFLNYDNLVQEKLVNLKQIKNAKLINSDNDSMLKFDNTNKTEIFLQIKKLKNKSNNNDLVLCNSFVKVLNIQISTIFSFYINLFYNMAYIPFELKKATILPKFKKGNKNNILNYRPIANINILAKLLERNMLVRIQKFA